MLENLRHNQKKNPLFLGDERVTSSKIRRVIRSKALIILRIRNEIRPKDRKWSYLGQELARKRGNRLLMYVLFAIAYS
jgi:hypothetical protein